ncbi:MAG: hypothetical protein RBU21_12480 [FCB group bacterium]|jgi:hypothetical protein|nr:hypothetical protein [FCB group bacterium]
MRDSEQSNAVLDLPHMAEVFEALRRGKHISMKDGDIYIALKRHEGAYEHLFSELGFKLVHHARDFFYFLDTSNFTELSGRIAVFMFILVEHLADQGDTVEDTVMTRRFAYKDLPHLHGERYQTYMREAGVTTADDLAAIVRTMERFGFTRRMDAETFCFDVPIYRFLDLCMDMAAKAGKAEAAPSTAADAGEVAP